MTYTIKTDTLQARIEREISRVAASSYSDDGVALYDSIKVTSRDKDILEDYCRDAINSICVAFAEHVTPATDSISLEFPDFDPTLEQSAQDELDRYVVYHTCAEWFKDKSVKDVESYTERANDALSKANMLLKSRKRPKRS